MPTPESPLRSTTTARARESRKPSADDAAREGELASVIEALKGIDLGGDGAAAGKTTTPEQAKAILEERTRAHEAKVFRGRERAAMADASDPKALITGGERVTLAARESDLRRTEGGKHHVTPIMVLTGYPARSEFVANLFKRAGIDAFVEKYVCDRIEYFSNELREMLENAGRGEHANCEGLRVGGAAAVGDASV